jgi:hypothetical protein
VVLLGQWGAEERHDAVAHHLGHRALVAVHGLHHALQHRVQHFACLLGVALGEQLEHHREAERHQRVEAADERARDDGLEQGGEGESGVS